MTGVLVHCTPASLFNTRGTEGASRLDDPFTILEYTVIIEADTLSIGKTYTYENPKAFPESMNGAKVTTLGFGCDKQSLKYDFVNNKGNTGTGSMSLEHAQAHLKPLAHPDS